MRRENNKREIKVTKIIFKSDSNKKIVINLTKNNTSSQKLLTVMRKIMKENYILSEIEVVIFDKNNKRNVEQKEIEAVDHLEEFSFNLLLIKVKNAEEKYILDLSEESNKLIKEILKVFYIKNKKLQYKGFAEENSDGEVDEYEINGVKLKIDGFLLNSTLIMRNSTEISTVELELEYLFLNAEKRSIKAVIFHNITDNTVHFEEVERIWITEFAQKKGIVLGMNNFQLKGNLVISLPIIEINNFEEEISNLNNMGYYIYHIIKNYQEHPILLS